MKKEENCENIKVCTRCGTIFEGCAALSRKNGKIICPDCGTREALESIGIDKTEQEKILGFIHQSMKERE